MRESQVRIRELSYSLWQAVPCHLPFAVSRQTVARFLYCFKNVTGSDLFSSGLLRQKNLRKKGLWYSYSRKRTATLTLWNFGMNDTKCGILTRRWSNVCFGGNIHFINKIIFNSTAFSESNLIELVVLTTHLIRKSVVEGKTQKPIFSIQHRKTANSVKPGEHVSPPPPLP